MNAIFLSNVNVSIGSFFCFGGSGLKNIGKEVGGVCGTGKKQISVSLEFVMLVDSRLQDEDISRKRGGSW